MYLNNLFIENMGSIERFQILEKDLFLEDGNPKPIILLGKNGSGKTTLLSCISDSFFELGNKVFNHILPNDGGGYKYYKVSGGGNTRIGANYSFSYLQFKQENDTYEYIDKNGELGFDDCKEKTNSLLTLQNNWKEKGNLKESSDVKNNKNFELDFGNNSYCVFPANRFEYPHWMIRDSYNKITNIKDPRKYNGDLGKSILVNDSMDEIKSWILDLFLDAKFRIKNNGSGYDFDDIKDPNNINILNQGIENIENLLSEILNKNIKLGINYRGQGSRISIIDGHNNEILLNNLDNLSAGESILLCMFSTIIRYSDMGDINKSYKLDEIEGIVVIDEIDLHLHIRLQKEILPKIIKLFPKIQFIVSTHSPFFLYGMNKEFGDDCLMLNMPSGFSISYNNFEEFGEAYEVFKDLTQDYQKKYETLKKEIEQQNKPIVFVEGPTDVQYIKQAYKLFNEKMDFDLKIIGTDSGGGTKNSNNDALRNAETFLKSNNDLVKQKIILLNDPEEKKVQEGNFGNLFVRKMKNFDNVLKHGIENLFNDEFIEKVVKENIDSFEYHVVGDKKTNFKIVNGNKQIVCNRICKNGTKQDFENFKGIFKIIDDILKIKI